LYGIRQSPTKTIYRPRPAQNPTYFVISFVFQKYIKTLKIMKKWLWQT